MQRIFHTWRQTFCGIKEGHRNIWESFRKQCACLNGIGWIMRKFLCKFQPPVCFIYRIIQRIRLRIIRADLLKHIFNSLLLLDFKNRLFKLLHAGGIVHQFQFCQCDIIAGRKFIAVFEFGDTVRDRFSILLGDLIEFPEIPIRPHRHSKTA